MTQEGVPADREELAKTVTRAENALVEAHKGHEKALKVVEKSRHDVGMEELVELVGEAQKFLFVKGGKRTGAIPEAELAIKRATSAVEDADWAENSKDFVASEERIRDAVRAVFVAEQVTLHKFGVSSVSINAAAGEGQLVTTENVPMSIRLTGEGIPKNYNRAPSTRAPSSNGSRARYVYVVGDQRYTSRELIQTYGDEHLTGRVTAAMILAEPTKHGLTHKADAIAAKMNIEKVPASE